MFTPTISTQMLNKRTLQKYDWAFTLHKNVCASGGTVPFIISLDTR